MAKQKRLTRPELPAGLQEKIDASVPGMAHWAMTGPAGLTCGDCDYWGDNRESTPWKSEAPRARCGRFTEMIGRQGPSVPHDTPACRFHVGPARWQRPAKKARKGKR